MKGFYREWKDNKRLFAPLIITWKLHIFKLLCFTFPTMLDSVHLHCDLISKTYFKKINITAIFIELKMSVYWFILIFLYMYIYIFVFLLNKLEFIKILLIHVVCESLGTIQSFWTKETLYCSILHFWMHLLRVVVAMYCARMIWWEDSVIGMQCRKQKKLFWKGDYK